MVLVIKKNNKITCCAESNRIESNLNLNPTEINKKLHWTDHDMKLSLLSE